MIRLLLQDNELELSEDLKVSLVYSIGDVKDFAKRTGNWSRSIKIPGTKNNNKLFKHYWEIGSDSEFDPNRKVRASIEEDYSRIFDGYIQLTQVERNLDQDTILYEITFFSDLSKFLKDISGLYLSDLDVLSAYTHTWTYENIKESWTKDYNYGYVYPILNYKNYSLNSINGNSIDTSVNMNDITPALYAKTVFDAIHKTAGYTYECREFETDRFRKLIYPMSKLFRSSEYINGQKFKIFQSANYNIPFTAYNSPPTAAFPYQDWLMRFPLDDATINGFDNSGLWNTSTYEYTATQTFRARFRMNSHWTTDPLASISIAINVYLNNNIVYQHSFILGSFNGVFYGNDIDVLFETPYIQLKPGDVLLVGSYSRNYTPYDYTVESDRTFFELSAIDENIQPGDTIDFQSTVPKMSQVEFYKDILQTYHIYVETSKEYNNHLVYKTKDDYYGDWEYLESRDNWSDKLDTTQPIKLTPLSELNERNIVFSWSPNDDYYSKLYKDKFQEEYGTRSIFIDNDFLAVNSKKLIQSKFTTAVNTLIPGSNLISLPNFYTKDNSGSIKSTKEKNVFLYFNGVYPSERYVINTGFTVNNQLQWISQNTYPFVSNCLGPKDDPDFSLVWDDPKETYYQFSGTSTYPVDNLYTRYYQTTIDEIVNKDSKMMEAYFNLKPKDLETLNFAHQKWIDIDGGHYWKIIRIVDYQPGKNGLTKVELLKSNDNTPRPVLQRKKYNYINTDTITSAERVEMGRNNQVLGGANSVVGGSNITESLSYYNSIQGRENTIKTGSENSMILGSSHYLQGINSAIIGGSGNTISGQTTTAKSGVILNSRNSALVESQSTIINSNNVKVFNPLNTSSGNTVISSSNLNILSGTNRTYIGIDGNYAGVYDNALYTQQLLIRSLTGATSENIGVNADGYVVRMAASSSSSGGFTGLTNGTNTYTGTTRGLSTVNISAATLDHITVTGQSIFHTTNAVNTTSDFQILQTGGTKIFKVFNKGLIEIGQYANDNPEYYIFPENEFANRTISRFNVIDPTDYVTGSTVAAFQGNAGNGSSGNCVVHVRSNLDSLLGSNDVLLVENTNTAGLSPHATNFVFRTIGGYGQARTTPFAVNHFNQVLMGTSAATTNATLTIQQSVWNNNSMKLISALDNTSREVFSLSGSGAIQSSFYTGNTTSQIVATTGGILQPFAQYISTIESDITHSDSNANIVHSFNLNQGEVYEVVSLGTFSVNNTGGFTIKTTGNTSVRGIVKSNQNSPLAVHLRAVSATGTTGNMGTAATTVFPYEWNAIVSAITNTTFSMGYAPFTNGQTITVHHGGSFIARRIR